MRQEVEKGKGREFYIIVRYIGRLDVREVDLEILGIVIFVCIFRVCRC